PTSPGFSVEDLLKVGLHRGTYFADADNFLTVAAFVEAVRWADPRVLYGFQAFISMTCEPNRVRTWAATGASQSGLPEHAGVGVLAGLGTREENVAAIDCLFEKLREFLGLKRERRLEPLVEAYVAGGGRNP